MTEDGKCVTEIDCRIAQAKEAFSNRKEVLTKSPWHIISFHPSLSSDLLFISTYDPTFISSNIPSRGLPLTSLPSILPSNTSFYKPFPFRTCPIQLFFLLVNI